MVYVWWIFREDWSEGGWVQGLWLSAYTGCWIGVCLGKKAAVFGYWGLMVGNLILLLVLDPVAATKFADPMSYMDVIFSLILLAYYKRL